MKRYLKSSSDTKYFANMCNIGASDDSEFSLDDITGTRGDLHVSFIYQDTLIGDYCIGKLFETTALNDPELVSELISIINNDSTVRDAIIGYLNRIYAGSNDPLLFIDNEPDTFIEDYSTLSAEELCGYFLEEIQYQVFDGWTFGDNDYDYCDLNIKAYTT